MKITDFGLIIHSSVVLLLVSLSLTRAGDISVISLMMLIWGVLFFTVFYFIGQNARPLPPADAVTSVRLLLGLIFFFLIRSADISPASALAIVFLIEFADGLDGWLARRTGTTKFGGIWDMESDAFVILLLSAGVYWFEVLPIWVLIPGVIRYVFFFPFLFLKPEGGKFPGSLSWFSKTVCVAAVFCLASAWYLPGAAFTAIAIITALISISFGWEMAFYIYLRVQTRKR